MRASPKKCDKSSTRPALPQCPPLLTHEAANSPPAGWAVGEFTRLIDAGADGDGIPADALWSAAYSELKHLAHSRLYHDGQSTLLDTTSLVNESYVKLAGIRTLRIHDALRELEALEPRLGKVVEMRNFGGLSDPEIAEILDVNVRTVGRDWDKARLLLREMLRR
jgi:DNA-binding transcriptional regulator YiaG